MADRSEVHTQLVCTAGQRLQLDPGGALARLVDHAIAGLGRLAVFLVDMHLFAARTRLLRERGIDHSFGDFRYAHDQSPIDLASRSTGKTL